MSQEAPTQSSLLSFFSRTLKPPEPSAVASTSVTQEPSAAVAEQPSANDAVDAPAKRMRGGEAAARVKREREDKLQVARRANQRLETQRLRYAFLDAPRDEHGALRQFARQTDSRKTTQKKKKSSSARLLFCVAVL